MRLSSWASPRFTIYLYCELEFPTLGHPQHRDSAKLPLSLDYSTLSPFLLLCEPFQPLFFL